MTHLSVNASAAAVGNAEHWKGWALGVADGVAQKVHAAI